MSEKLPFFDEEVLYEVIVSTVDDTKQPNAAPMGVRYSNGQLILQPYLTRTTYQNLLTNKEAVINVTTSPELFVKAALFQEEFNAEDFLTSLVSSAPFLKACAHSFIVVRVSSFSIDDLKARFLCEIVRVDLSEFRPRLYTRAFSSLIEILIHATRVLAFQRDKDKESEVSRLLELIDYHQKIIGRVTSKNSMYQILMRKINSKINQVRV
ncbi:MAG: hypothetical protein DRO63_00175 [Candidatus Gerdarchaeota archaeon]|nr:MAG: hypothetical protein DRO63_00175 [Candidatus Gerdarchaeota archaeon]